jgi:hypothetical protein
VRISADDRAYLAGKAASQGATVASLIRLLVRRDRETSPRERADAA